MIAKHMDVALMKQLLYGGAANLRKNCETVNDLNVFPIPDGDTGDNMSLTFQGGIRQLSGREPESVGEAARLVAEGMLLSARGNSGVILSQFFSGLAGGLENVENATVSDLARAFREGVRLSYAAVITPTEGTILTVAREGVEYAASRVNEDSTLESFGEDFLAEVRRSLEHTPELLQVLKEAGVVDSGGAGLYYIAEGMLKVLQGESIPDAEETTPEAGVSSVSAPDFSKFTENDVMEYGYCTEFILRLTRSKTDVEAFDIRTFIDYFESIGGDSVVAVKNGSIVKIHVHTLTPEKVLAFAHDYGEFLTLKIENMTLQHHETTIENRYELASTEKDGIDAWHIKQEPDEKKRFGIVTVAEGEGIVRTLKELGADVVVEGGQGKNPSTADFLRAYQEVNAKTVFVFPNNGNIILAAEQAAGKFQDAEIRVIPDKSIGEGYAALTMMDPTIEDADEMERSFMEAIEGVETGLVSRSIRTTTVDSVSIRENEYIGFTKNRMYVSEETMAGAAAALSEALSVGNREFLIVIYGLHASAEQRNAFRDYMKTNHRRTELCEIDGGQEVYDFILIFQ